MICALCPRRCKAERGEGVCGMSYLPVVARAAPHFGEEPCISGTRGSGAVFFCGCALGCVFCQNIDISRGMPESAKTLTPEGLCGVLETLESTGVHNLNLVTASHFAPAVAKALRLRKPRVPVVWNSSGYESEEILDLLDGLVDVYLPDYKYADARLAKVCANAPDYPEVALSAIARMRRQTGAAAFDADGMMTRGTLVRHLVLPGLAGASMRALTRLREALPGDVQISLMGQYTPVAGACAIPALNRPVSKGTYDKVAAHMRALAFEGYVQEIASSGTTMIPLWDGTGVTGC